MFSIDDRAGNVTTTVAFFLIAAVAVRVLEDAGRFTGKRFDLASDGE